MINDEVVRVRSGEARRLLTRAHIAQKLGLGLSRSHIQPSEPRKRPNLGELLADELRKLR